MYEIIQQVICTLSTCGWTGLSANKSKCSASTDFIWLQVIIQILETKISEIKLLTGIWNSSSSISLNFISIYTNFNSTIFQESRATTDIRVLNVSVFYQSQSPFSMRFFKKKLIKTWQSLKEYINLDLIPVAQVNTQFL